MKHLTIHFLFLITILLSTSCSLSRTLPEGGHLYRGSKVKIKREVRGINSKSLETNYKALLKNPKPNKTFLGILWGVRMYNLFETKKEKGTRHWLQKVLGKEPVIYDEKRTEKTEKVMSNKAFNSGFFHATVESKVKKRRHKAKVKYIVRINKPYIVGGLRNAVSDTSIQREIAQIQNAALLKTGKPYTLNSLKKERERIAISLRQKGFYFFIDDFLIFNADTTKKDKTVYLELDLKEDLPPGSLKKQRINKIVVYPNQSILTNKQRLNDTIPIEDIKIISSGGLIKASTLRDAILFERGKLYTVETHQKTVERLSFLQNFQFIDIQFEPLKEVDSLLNVVIRLTPRKREAIEGSLGLSLKSGLFFGPEISLSYLNRNVFRGAEQFRFTIFGNYNFPLVDNIASQTEQGLKLELSKPRLLIPFKKKGWPGKMVAQTKMLMDYSREQIRLPLFQLRSELDEADFPDLTERLDTDNTYSPFVAFVESEFSIAYQWRNRPGMQHELAPLTFELQNTKYEINELEKLLLELSLLGDSSDGLFLNLQSMLILKPGYTFLYDSRLKKTKKHNHFYRGKLSVAGNRLLSPIDETLRTELESQFFQLENDFRYYWRQSWRSTIAFRFATNVSIPFKNEVILPFFDLYKIGGPNSVRAFRPRLVGPGSVEPVEEIFFFTGTGNFLLESSLEWRVKLTQVFELGFFVDAGNVWLLKGEADQNELATFKWNNFYNQVATGTGLGFRFDFDIILIRCDFSFPLSKPWLPEGERLVANKIDFGNADWRKDNLTFYLAFGYAF